MKKLFFIILGILFALPCFASEQVYILGPSNTLITPNYIGTSVTSGQNANVSSASAVVLGSSTNTGEITILALSTNRDYIYVGNSAVTSSTGFVLSTGSVLTLTVDNLADVYVIAGNGGGKTDNKISYIATVK